MKRLTGALGGLFVPSACAGCGGSLRSGMAGRLCVPCTGRIDRLQEPWCSICGVPMALQSVGGGPPTCDHCRLGRSFGEARAYGLFEGPLRDLLTRFKYSGQQSLGEPLGNLLANAASELLSVQDYDVIVPVPLHRDRLAERGFNQAYLLARPLAAKRRLPVVAAVERILSSAAQVGLQGEQRRANVRDAFGLHPRRKAEVARRRVLLVDDVLTTGATADECARVLRSAGAAAVDVITVARTP